MARGTLDGKKMRGYRQEDDVSAHSQTETFAALKLFVDNWRWQGVPFYLRTGKRLPRQVSEVAIQFRAVPHQSFPPESSRDWHPSRLVLSIQPEEGIVLDFQAKYPGPTMLLRPVEMRFSYQENFAIPSPDAYETLLWDVMNNDPTLFMRADQVEAAWQILDARAGGVGKQSSSQFSQLCRRQLGTQGRRRVARDAMGTRGGQSHENPGH